MTRPLPDDVRAELTRIGRRWEQLPLAIAAQASPAVREVAQRLADAALAPGAPCPELPDLGPGSVIHQLEVCTYDAVLGGVPPTTIVERLTALRATLP